MKSGILVGFYNFFVRGILGMGIIYFLNIFIEGQGLIGNVGLNLLTFCTSGALGIPGIGLLYGIQFFQFL